MKPALSVIFFTTVSGAGYGMLFWLGVFDTLGLVPRATWFGPASVATAMVLCSAGLIASTSHLARPERAWRAVSQWRTSWLSREGIAALFAFPPAALLALFWAALGARTPVTVALALLAAAAAAATVVCTAMIYASLTPIRQWHNRFTLPNYLVLSLYSGAACLASVASFWQIGPARLAAGIAAALAIPGAAGKLLYWRAMDRPAGAPTIESATGLGFLGPVRMLDAPNTEENYLLREMGFRIARKHAARLRGIALGLGFAAPFGLLLAGAAPGRPAANALMPTAAAVCLVGLYVERWLFFAQATHTVRLYYGRPA